MVPEGHLREALTFDDVLLVPAESDVLPRDVDVRTQLTPAIALANPILSSAMDTVTEARTAICMAREGGLGILHKNMGIAEQALEVQKVKKAETGVVVDPVTIGPDQKLSEALELMRRFEISGLPVVGSDGHLVGILTNRDVRFERNLDQPVRNMMTTKLITGPEGLSLEASKELLHKNRIEKLLVVDGANKLRGLLTIKDTGDVTKAIAAGAHTVMIGSLFAGTDEAPGEIILYQGRSYKQYRGMGSIGAMQAGSKDRYFQEGQSEAKL